MREHDACGIGFVADRHGRASHTIVTAALQGLAGVRHRGAVAADARTSDGTGVLTPIPPRLFGEGHGVAVLFARTDDLVAVRDAVEAAAIAEGLRVVEWREPPTDPGALGVAARRSAPTILEAVLAADSIDDAMIDDDTIRDDTIRDDPDDDRSDAHDRRDDDARERAAYRMRRRLVPLRDTVYVASCSFRTMVHKGLAAADALGAFYLDLLDPAFEVPFAVFHQRFSTNTEPTWERTQPFRTLCHNGEINTVDGNERRMVARGVLGTEAAGLGPEDLFRPLLDHATSDSGRLDETVELLVRGGRPIAHAVAMLVPEAWELVRDLEPAVRGFYEYHSALVEPWDGPAGLIFTDGRIVGAALDRNGLRPLRYAICSDGLIVCCSEMGAVDLRGHGTVERGRLGPGHLVVVHPEHGFIDDGPVKDALAARAPYARWAADGFLPWPEGEPVSDTPDDLSRRQVAHGYTKEDLAMVLKPMAEDAYEPTFAMGDDSPLPTMAGRARPVAHYLRQRFAQVTNPPIDPLRERLVMSTRMLLGPRRPILSQTPDAARLIELSSFVLYPSAVEDLGDPARNPFAVSRFSVTVAADDPEASIEGELVALAAHVEAAVADGCGIVVLDQATVGPDRYPVPSLLAVGAVHQHLTASGQRSATSIVVVADDVWDVHGVAALLAYGADAVCPQLALETVAAEADRSDSAEIVSPEAQSRYVTALEKGVLKVLSKMGIATADSYRGSQLFEAIGLGPAIVDRCFTGTPSVVGGIGWDELTEDLLGHHARAWAVVDDTDAGDDDAEDGVAVELESPGYVRVRKGGEYHANSKEVVDALTTLTGSAEPPRAAGRGRARRGDGDATTAVAPPAVDPAVADMAAAHLLQRAIALGQDGGSSESYEQYERFAALVNERPPTELHDLLVPTPLGPPVPLDEVEPASEVVRRFSTGAMSHGSLSQEAHENLAQAMNLIGGRSNCGEGGEDPARLATRGLGRDDKNSKVKQVASGRFGVTPEYLAHADEIQIKVAQGSKPGEGGQLPGHKVSKDIARLRHTQPGVGLISPPPHHDIYSIEDLAQLIYDLKQVNAAQVSVKLVAEDGVGTVAAGVVKALADVVHISGANGGTGASPLSSIKHAGMPWELGLADTQQTLVANGLRERVRVRVDGGFKTGRQVIAAALLGADEYAFGTAAMIAEGCIMLRACHRDTCKPGVATQRPNLRANFRGTPEGVAAYFLFVAEEVRRTMAALGARSLDELVGRVDLLRQRATGDPRVDLLDLSPLIVAVEPPEPIVSGADEQLVGHPSPPAPRFVERVAAQDPRSDLGDRLLADAYRAVWDGDRVDLRYEIRNTDRTFGAALAGALALEYGTTVPRGGAHVEVAGTAGQSFGAFLSAGIELDLTGEANDYVGKGMGGGRIVIRPPADDVTADRSGRRRPVLAGNTCLYGATGGELYVAGSAGERFAVRNSGAIAVVEAVGDHCCEYMTGGTVVVLGRVGYNVGAGMTGGQAFIWDPEIERIMTRVNTDLVEVVRPDHGSLGELRWLVERHAELTRSIRSRALLDEWDERSHQLWHVLPRGARRARTDTPARVATA